MFTRKLHELASLQTYTLLTFFFYYRDSLWSVLTGKNLENGSSFVLHDVREIETWILRLLSSPVSVPGSTRVEVRPDSYIVNCLETTKNMV